jgi:hypothetical protein
MDILGKARRLEEKVSRTIDRAAHKLTRSSGHAPLEILHAIVDAVGERLEPAGRGTQVFPFNRIRIAVLAPSREDRARFEAVFDGEPSLRDRIVQRLQDGGCELSGLSVRTTCVDRVGADWTRPEFHIEFDRTAAIEPRAEPEAAPTPAVKLSIVHGQADEPAYTFALARINLGRCAEVRDSRNRLVRINHVAFADVNGEPNQSVSRRHAHIEYVEETRDHRICDDQSGHGTSVVRNGRTVPVPSGSRGIRLESGDEIVLGEARLSVELGE